MIALANMPFMLLNNPELAPALISALLKNSGMEVTSFYFNADFARDIGYERYMELSKYGVHIQAGVCEWLFAGSAWGWDAARENEALEKLISLKNSRFGPSSMEWLRRIRYDIIPGFMSRCVDKLKSIPDLSVVGFSSLFQYTPFLAMGRMVREALPDVKLVYGGSAFYGEMGLELFDKVEWIDAISTSEADDVLPEVFRRLCEGEPLDDLRGMAYRDRVTGRIYKTPGSPISQEVFDNDIVPDFDDYFATLAAHDLTRFYRDNSHLCYLPFESSRGCWWRDKCQCTFCGINRDGSYRQKSSENVLSILGEYRRKYGVTQFAAMDANLSMDYFDTFIPEVKTAFPEGVGLFYCVKASMGRNHIRALAESGVRSLQPGIESLSDHVLKLMKKGVSALQNIFFLKCARQYGIFPFWFILLGSSGETVEDCLEIAALIPRLTHFTPPGGVEFVQIHRYSEYWRNSDRYLDGMAPLQPYKLLFSDEIDLMKLAYIFDAQWKGDRKALEDAWAIVHERVDEWQALWEGERGNREGPLMCVAGDGLSVIDTRGGDAVQILFEPEEAAIYGMLDDIIPEAFLLERTSEICDATTAKGILDSFVEQGLALRSGGSYLGLALREGFSKLPFLRDYVVQNLNRN